jgi:hypothetical protein
VLKHIRASKVEFLGEIESAGFKRVGDAPAPKLKENFMAQFRRADQPRTRR